MYYYLHLCAPNDKNGNAQRLYLILIGGEPTRAIAEGCFGPAELRARYGDIAGGMRIDVAATEYRRILRRYG